MFRSCRVRRRASDVADGLPCGWFSQMPNQAKRNFLGFFPQASTPRLPGKLGAQAPY